ncbi:ribose transport system substrate-binding protein/inositol transport system substrate-binding protein [Pseudomonas duriflava]|uniref:Ribose transport system substrate-binding protein/inositol transport system substrate-binding protein n=1 Tax=Pseudomonas duriflava TaxID=459528 RepID=A0A562QDU0_9PSED|nr:sugar ABC transporter substrate-binding protein [Pseudomonas duriflava]TWI54927.1 ribose transport system substrate-binding protein/inositol transport system substrate-binding protein [Pseudomonas duriflava]
MMRCLSMLLCLLISPLAWSEAKIGVAVAQYDNYIAYLVQAMQERAKEVPGGATLQLEDAGGDVVRQLGQVENFISQSVDAIIVNPADTAATRKITERATLAGIPLVYLNSRPEVESFPAGVVFVGTDERRIGQMQMEYLAEKMGGKGDLAIILGRLAHDDTRKRTAGVKDVLAKYPDIKVVEEQSANWERDKGMDVMSNWLLSGKNIDAVAANNDEMGIGAAMALRQAGSQDVMVGGVDGTADGLDAIKRGLLSVTVFRDTVGIGAGSVDAAVRLINKENLQGDIWVPVQLVTPENYQQFQSK